MVVAVHEDIVAGLNNVAFGHALEALTLNQVCPSLSNLAIVS
jgi:hypothetical protein